jgi:cholestenol Delta-isomerase
MEGYSSTQFRSIATSQDLLAQLWREYALADSRYIIENPLPICIDGITAVGFHV